MENNDKNTLADPRCVLCKNSINNCNRGKVNKELLPEDEIKRRKSCVGI